jgi:hypothetical protein
MALLSAFVHAVSGRRAGARTGWDAPFAINQKKEQSLLHTK